MTLNDLRFNAAKEARYKRSDDEKDSDSQLIRSEHAVQEFESVRALFRSILESLMS